MNFLEERITKDGIVKEGNVLKVDSFLNHQMDIRLFDQIGEEFKKRFEGTEINKILTIEASGIGIACVVADILMCLLYLLKKFKEHQHRGRCVMWQRLSHLHTSARIRLSCPRSSSILMDKILIIDDFLANGVRFRDLSP